MRVSPAGKKIFAFLYLPLLFALTAAVGPAGKHVAPSLPSLSGQFHPFVFAPSAPALPPERSTAQTDRIILREEKERPANPNSCSCCTNVSSRRPVDDVVPLSRDKGRKLEAEPDHSLLFDQSHPYPPLYFYLWFGFFPSFLSLSIFVLPTTLA